MSYLLMGGQACVLYGGAEFSRDINLTLLSDESSIHRFKTALAELQAERIAVPPSEIQYLNEGHAVHFRSRAPDSEDMRIDVMTVMRGVAPFDELWNRRTTFELDGGQLVDVLALPDLVRAKKTQCDKDWVMIRALLNVNYYENKTQPTPAHLNLWFREMRDPLHLIELAQGFASDCLAASVARPLLSFATQNNRSELEAALREEEQSERDADRAYWTPLKKQLEQLRHQRGRG